MISLKNKIAFRRKILMDNIIQRIGLNIIKIREKKKLSQEKLAALAGLHRAYIGQIERGEKNIGLKNLEKIAKALQVPTRRLVEDPNSID